MFLFCLLFGTVVGLLPRRAGDAGDAGGSGVAAVVVIGSSVGNPPLLSPMLRGLSSLLLLLPPPSLPTSPKSVELEPSVNNDVDDETSPLIFI